MIGKKVKFLNRNFSCFTETKNFSKKGQSLLQIFILIVSTFAFAYLVYQTTGFVSAQGFEGLGPGEEWEVFAGFGAVDLESISLSCCSSSCQDLPNFVCEDNCEGECLPTSCGETVDCERGCCFDSVTGSCGLRAPKKTCEESGGVWSSGGFCSISECERGCCVLGSEGRFVTERMCEVLSENRGLQTEFLPNIRTELGCLAEANSQAEGACILNNDCKFWTATKCSQLNGQFFANYLCSHPDLESDCERQIDTGCVAGKDEVYWFDSCGNIENIYDSNKERSWNGGKVLSKEESCGSGQGNINSKSCGNCNFPEGSSCKEAGRIAPDEGNFICGDLNCYDAPANGGGTEDRKNGESWCIYESYIGEGLDIPGSRHYKYYCYDGEVKTEPCGDYRTGICVESIGDGFSDAACRPNKAMQCISYNTEGDIEDCGENPDCEIRILDFGRKYRFDVCTPKYPIGFDFSSSGGMKAASEICNQADFTCVKVLEKGWSGWDCIQGCECDTLSFTQQMNDWCSSLGDCGVSVNLNGDLTTFGYDVSGAPKLEAGVLDIIAAVITPRFRGDNNYIKKLISYMNPVAGQYAEPGDDIFELLEAVYGWNFQEPEEFEQEDYSAYLEIGSAVAGIGGKILSGAVAKAAYAGAVAKLSATATAADVAAAGTEAAATSSTSFLGALGFAAAGAAIGAGIGLMIAKSMGLGGEGAIYMAGGGAIAGASIGLAMAGVGSFAGEVILGLGVLGIIGIAIGIVIMVTVALMGIGKTKKRTITFNCETWQPPRGGKDCDKCGEIGDCTKYKCSTYGQTCEFINQGTGNEMCVDNNPNDITPPRISEWDDFITTGYKYDDVSDSGFKIVAENGECLTEFTPVVFGIKTDEPSQCKIDTEHKSEFDDMSNYFGESNIFDYEHMMVFNMPTVESLLIGLDEDLTEEEIANLRAIATNRLGQMDFYVRCIDKNGNSATREYVISTCVKPGEDLTAPFVTFSNPQNNNFLKWNETEKAFTIWTSEPSTCKYNVNTDLDWESMTNEFVCLNDYEDVELKGWRCDANLTGLGAGENKIYVKCADQPWFIGTENESQRNIRTESDVINLIRSSGELKIDSVEPSGVLESGTAITSLDLEVKTSGGAESGRAGCSYSFSGFDNLIRMRNTDSNQHKQVLSQMIGGNYDVYIECIDVAGNIATAKEGFRLIVDIVPPQIVRAYKIDGDLKIVTDENSECVFNDKENFECRYLWVNGTSLSGSEQMHTTKWEEGKNYYIKCKDEWGNQPDRCSFIANAQDYKNL